MPKIHFEGQIEGVSQNDLSVMRKITPGLCSSRGVIIDLDSSQLPCWRHQLRPRGKHVGSPRERIENIQMGSWVRQAPQESSYG
jgi:hypothetical protein